jgi:hypothetical protein
MLVGGEHLDHLTLMTDERGYKGKGEGNLVR